MIKVNSINKSFSSGKVSVIKNISFDLPDCGLVVINGRSGCGKTTLLNLLGGLDGTDAGSICYVDGSGKEVDICSLNDKEATEFRAKNIGFVFQDYKLINEWNVKDNLRTVAERLVDSNEIDERVKTALEFVDLSGLEKRYIKELSGGQQQRVALARAIINKPYCIFADEPTGNLDFESGEKIMSLLKDYSRQSLVVVVSHDRELSEKYADRIIKLQDGIIVEDAEITESCNNKKCFPEKKMKNISFSQTIKLALTNLGIKKIKLSLSIIAIAFLVFLLEIVATFAFNDYGRAFREYLKVYETKTLFAYSDAECTDIIGGNEVVKIENSKSLLNRFANTFGKDKIIPTLENIEISANQKTTAVNVSIGGKTYNKVRFEGTMPIGANEIVITDQIAKELHIEGDPIGKTVLIFGQNFTVTGVSYCMENLAAKDLFSFAYRVIVSENVKTSMLQGDEILLPLVCLLDNRTIEERIYNKTRIVPVSSLDRSRVNIEGDWLANNNEIMVSRCFFEEEMLDEWMPGSGSVLNFLDIVGINSELDGFLNITKYISNFKLTGIIDSENKGADIVVSDEVFERLKKDYYESFFADAYEIQIESYKDVNIKKLNELIDSKVIFDSYGFELIYAKKNNNNFFGTIIKAVFLGGIALLIVLMTLFISINVKDNHMTIGVLKALGMSSKEITRIWCVESFILCSFSFGLASLGKAIYLAKKNNEFYKHSRMAINLYASNPAICGAIYALLVILGLLLVVLPVVFMENKKPIELIRQR